MRRSKQTPVEEKPAKKTGPDLVDEMAKEPTLDRYFDINPSKLTDDDLWELIGIERGRRAMFIKKGE